MLAPPACAAGAPEQAQFVETIRQLLGNDNNLRKAAEHRYDEAKKHQPAATVVALFQVLQEPQVEQPVREQGAVLLRQCLAKAKEEGSIWLQLGAAGQADVQARLLQLVQTEPLAPVRRKIADCVQSLANNLIDVGDDEQPKNAKEWAELMPTLMGAICDSSKDTGLRADCVWIVKEMVCSVWKILLASSAQVYQTLHICLADPAEAVKAQAARLLCELVDYIESKEDRKPFAPLVLELSEVIKQLANSSDPRHLNEVLQGLQTTTETADFLKSHLASHMMPLLTTIAKSHSDDTARKAAFEAIANFMENKPKMMIKIPQYIEQALEVCVTFILELEDDVEAWALEDDEEGEDEDHFTLGKETLDRICRYLSKVDAFSNALEVLKPVITGLFSSGEWKRVVAAITTISQIAEYIDDEAMVAQMLVAVKSQLAATNARVRYVAWGAIAQFAEDHSDLVTSEDWARQLLPEFLNGLDDACPRVAFRSMEAFQHYGESLEREDLEPFVQPLMEKLGVRLQSGPLFQKKSITFIAVIAGQVADAFAPYYGPLMPLLKNVIQDTLHKTEERTLLGKCFECISLLARAVGREVFRSDAEQIMQAMIQATQAPNLPNDDPVKEYMMAASERICSTMKEDFLPFVPHLLPGILEKLTLAPKEFSNENFGGDANLAEQEVNLTVTQEDGKMKILVMYTSEIQDLRGALECIHTFVEELGKAYGQFVSQTASALLPVFEFSMAEEIRDLAFETWGQLCSCASAGGQAHVVSELVMEFLKRILPKLDTNEVDIQALTTRVDGITTCLKKAGPAILSIDQTQHLCQVSLKLLEESFKRREESTKARKEQPDEDGDAEEDEEEEEQSLRVSLCEVAGAIMQHHPDLFIQAAAGLQEYLQLVQRLLQQQASTDDRKLAAFVACDFMDHLGSRVTAHWPQFLPGILRDVLHSSPELRQPACYGLSLAAKDPAFATLAADAAGKLSQVVTESRSRGKKKSEKLTQACADNALSALVEILLSHPAAVAAAQAQLWGVWMGGLPCQEDEQEGVKNHGILLRLLQQERLEVVGESGQNVPKLLGTLVDVYSTDMVDEQTSLGIGQLAQRLGEARLQQYAAQWTEKRKKKLLRIVREAAKKAATP